MKNIIRVVCFCLFLLLILKKTDDIFKFKYGDGIYGIQKFYEQKEDTVDTLILGSSHAFEDINTGVFWEKYGIASYILAGSFQPMWNTYYYLKEALKTQEPELIVLEAYTTIIDSDYMDDSRIIKNTYGMKWSKDRIDAVKISAPQKRWMEFLLPYMQYHTRYAELSREDFLKNKGNIQYESWKGFGCNMAVTAFPTPDISKVTKREKMSNKTETYYRKIIELALQSKIPILVVLSPYAGITEEEQAVFLSAGDIAKEYGVDFINYNLLYKESDIDFSKDAADPGHLNYRGNQKFSSVLGQYISDHYDITDRRGDAEYQSWEKQTKYIMATIRNQELKEAVTVEDLAKRMKNPNYKICVSLNGDCAGDEQNLEKLFQKLAIPYIKNSGFWVIDGDNYKVQYANRMEEDFLHFRWDGHDLCIRRWFDEGSLSYVNMLTFDRTVYQKVESGVNILVYCTITQSVVNDFGIQAEDFIVKKDGCLDIKRDSNRNSNTSFMAESG